VPTANLPVALELGGPGANIGVGNGDPNSHEPEKGNKVTIYNGLAQVILQSRRGGAGTLVLRATAAGLKPAETAISVLSVPALPSVPVVAD
jgi:beta-galactosidase